MNQKISVFQIQSQQYYLRKFGFYVGEIDGVWRDTCKEAMALFQKDEHYYPATKTTTTPFMPFEVLPEGFTWERVAGQQGIVLKDALPFSFTLKKMLDDIQNNH